MYIDSCQIYTLIDYHKWLVVGGLVMDKAQSWEKFDLFEEGKCMTTCLPQNEILTGM